MGVSIDLHIYDYFDLIKDIRKQVSETENVPEDRTLNFFVENILPEFGIRTGDKFVTLWNEYYEEYNSGSELMQAVSLYFGLEDCWLGDYETSGHANAREVLDSLGITPIGEDEDDDY